jgi:hypothetical protein
MLQSYYDIQDRHNHNLLNTCIDTRDCDACIRVDNYMKALCRGGQIEAGLGLDNFVSEYDWANYAKRVGWIKK